MYFRIFLIIAILWCFSMTIQAQEPKIFNFDKYDYFIFRGERLTMEGVIDAIIEAKKDKCVAELKKMILGK